MFYREIYITLKTSHLFYLIEKENKELQRSVFEDQLEMALNTQKAIVLHLREAEEDLDDERIEE